MNFLTACKNRYYSKDNSVEIKKRIQEKLNPNITDISHEMLCIFDDILNKKPSSYWNNSVYTQTYSELERLYGERKDPIRFGEEIIGHFLTGYHTYCQITGTINDLEKLNDSPEIRNRLYRIPTYVSIVDGCLTNFFRVITLILDQTSTEDFASINELQPICEILKSNHFNLLVADVNVNISNAISHGGILYKDNGQEIDFLYTENRKSVVFSTRANELDRLINKVYDTASGVLLGLCNFINDHIDRMNVNKSEKFFIPFCLLGMELSIPSIRCRSINELSNQTQLNVDVNIDNADRTFILQTAIELSMLVYERYNDYENYYFSFRNERLQASWIRFANQDIYDMIYKNRTFEDVLTDISQRNDCQIWEPSTEEIDLQEIKYHRFPNYDALDFEINKVEDVSIPGRKRLKAYLYIQDTSEKLQIMEKIQKSIAWLKQLKNVSSPTIPHKYGIMEADSLYISVFQFDSRMDKELLPSQNDNFVCCVDYNMDGETVLQDGGLPPYIWRQLHHEKIGDLRIAWRDEKYVMKQGTHKVGRNEPCPCGSGEKYKKCCMSKEI